MKDSINFKADENAAQRHSFDEWVQVQPARARKSASGAGEKDDRCGTVCCGSASCDTHCSDARRAGKMLRSETRKAAKERGARDTVLGINICFNKITWNFLESAR